MLDEILPAKIANALDSIQYNKICELRLRNDSPIVVDCLGKRYFLGEDSLLESNENALILGKGVLSSIVQKLSNNSLYSINDQLIDGYISYLGGVRVGVCGEVVSVDGVLKTIKNISSLNFRFPHYIKNCSLDLFSYIYANGGFKSTLIASPPGVGKTTYLRDIIYQLSKDDKLYNILVVDERQELTSIYNKESIIKFDNVDVYSNCSKKFAFNNGIRSMKPDIIITDEINIEKDIEDIENALTSGVVVFASIHASSVTDLKNKTGFKEILSKKLFERFVFLSNEGSVCHIAGVYNQNLQFIGV